MRPLIVGQITGVSQFAAVIAPAVLCRPHRWPSSNQATTLESQPIQGIQYVSGQTLRAGPPLTVDIPLDMVIYDDFLDVGFARNYASSQAYNEKYQGNPNVIPVNADDGLKFKKVPGDVYEWLDSRLTI